MSIQVKRVYLEGSEEDGYRVLVDRLWPRGVSKERARLDLWLKEIAPSTELRKWFGHDPAKWDEFRARYWQELDANPEVVRLLAQRAHSGRVTLLYAARDEAHNEAIALKEYLDRKGQAHGP